MRAREFITEHSKLPDEAAYPLRHTYIIPGISASDPYHNYRFGVALARARSDSGKDDVNPYIDPWSAEAAFGENGVIVGFNDGIGQVIDKALQMTEIPDGKRLAGTAESEEPTTVNTKSPVSSFKGYKRR
jgi:hypothetical protein